MSDLAQSAQVEPGVQIHVALARPDPSPAITIVFVVSVFAALRILDKALDRIKTIEKWIEERDQADKGQANKGHEAESAAIGFVAQDGGSKNG